VSPMAESRGQKRRSPSSCGAPSLADALSLTQEARVVTQAAPPWRIVHISKAWSELTGWRFTEVVGRTCALLQGEGTDVAGLAELHTALSVHEHASTTLINYTRDGMPFRCILNCELVEGGSHFCATIKGTPIVDGSVAPLRAPANREAIAAAAARAATPIGPVSYVERQRGQRMKRSLGKVRLADALANTTDPLVLCTKDYPHVIMHPNQPWLEMCGYALEEVEGLTNKILTGPETDTAALERLNACVRREEDASETLVNYKKGGVRFVNQLRVFPVYDENDELAAFMSMLHEVDNLPLSSHTH
jgi:PAS domain S-box-containing protein